jgi:streptomycin 6-kinase
VELSHAEWLKRVPSLLDECRELWGLRLGEPYEAGAAGHAVRAELPDTTPAVLKLIHPHRETEQEAAALEHWRGDGAVLLLDHDPERWALLLERCEPGTTLSVVGGEAALDVLIELLPRLWRPAAEPFRPLSDEAAWWAASMPEWWEQSGRPFERKLLDAALDALTGLSPLQGEQVLLHQDLHPDNVLAAAREPWLAIDPKPLVGEREFGLAPIVRAWQLGHSRDAAIGRLDRLTSELGLDRERARGWALGQALAWAWDGELHKSHLDVARWLLAD